MNATIIEMNASETGIFSAAISNPPAVITEESTEETTEQNQTCTKEDEKAIIKGYGLAVKQSEVYQEQLLSLAERGITNILAHYQQSSLWPSRTMKNGSVKPWGVSKALDPAIDIKAKEREFVKAFRAFDQWLISQKPKAEKQPKNEGETEEESEEIDEVTAKAANMNQFEVLRQMFMDKGLADDVLKIKKGASIVEIITALESAFTAE